jgi:hypothetical protein
VHARRSAVRMILPLRTAVRRLYLLRHGIVIVIFVVVAFSQGDTEAEI